MLGHLPEPDWGGSQLMRAFVCSHFCLLTQKSDHADIQKSDHDDNHHHYRYAIFIPAAAPPGNVCVGHLPREHVPACRCANAMCKKKMHTHTRTRARTRTRTHTRFAKQIARIHTRLPTQLVGATASNLEMAGSSPCCAIFCSLWSPSHVYCLIV